MSRGTSLARFQTFLQSVGGKGAEGAASEPAAAFEAPERPRTAHGRFSSVRASADAVMQSPPIGGSAAGGAASVAGFDSLRVDPPPEFPAAALQSPMLRAIAARKTLEPLDLDRGGLRMASAGHRRTKTAH